MVTKGDLNYLNVHLEMEILVSQIKSPKTHSAQI